MDQAAAGRALRKYLLAPHRYSVIAIKGPWGCGKTHLLLKAQEWLKEESGDRDAPSSLYCSLFGLDSVADIRKELLAQVWEEAIPGASQASKMTSKVGGKLADIIGLFSKTGETITKIGGVVLNAATDAITDRALRGRRIVLDDMERRGADLSVIAVLGFVDFLRNNGSQVVVLFNDEKIGSPNAQADLKNFREKAFSVELQVLPSAAEAYDIALGDIKPLFEPVLRVEYLRLGITNIRVGQRVIKAVEYIFAEQQSLSRDIVQEVMPAIVVVAGLFYEALQDWPSLREIEKRCLNVVWTRLERGHANARDPI